MATVNHDKKRKADEISAPSVPESTAVLARLDALEIKVQKLEKKCMKQEMKFEAFKDDFYEKDEKKGGKVFIPGKTLGLQKYLWAWVKHAEETLEKQHSIIVKLPERDSSPA